MPSHYYDRYHKDGYELAHHIGRDLRHSHRPTRYIINEGKLVIDERTFDYRDRSSSSRSNTVVYNAPGSTMWVEKHHRDEKSHHKSECRACFRTTHDRCYDGYCYNCLTLRLDTPRRREVITVHDRRLVEHPERKALQWRW